MNSEYGDIDVRQEYYSKTFVLLEIVKNMQGREVCFLKSKVDVEGYSRKATPVRCVKAHSLDYLKKNFEAFGFSQKNYNIYSSVASFKDMPMFSYNPVKRKAEQDLFFNEGLFSACWVGYDFAIDIDGNTIDEAYKDAKKVKALFDGFGVSYSLRFSGLRGFHFVVPYEYFAPKDMKLKEVVKLCEHIAFGISAVEDITSIDLSIYQPQRVLKAPYSIGGGTNVCLPLSDKEFENFNIKDMQIDNVLKRVNLKGRGLLQRQNLNNCNALIDMYGGY